MTIDLQESRTALYSAVLSDVMDGLGLMNQAMATFVRPLDESLVMMGRARTGLYMDVYSIEDGEDPYDVEIAMVDDLKTGDVAVLACRGPTTRIAPWGELLSTAARCRGAQGCVTDGLVRDIRKIREMNFPVFHGGIGPLDSKGRAKMMKRDVPIDCAGVRIHPGDIVFGDADGVVVVPQARAEEVIAAALRKVTSENHTRDALLEGKLLREVYDEFGVL
ncbi:RraA family protein [Xanthobacteraceae bacterium Astr-EGSB]|uniref:RraA family protein n=1 Tax=Astrobacterium formosum TaxID=3069710 RepID=UPI0027AF60B4|nr:RraA family protein [Xanthobacteraceae bacterium Astr-EGSB]